MDSELNLMIDDIFKIRNRETKKALMAEVEKIKPQVTTAISLLRDQL